MYVFLYMYVRIYRKDDGWNGWMMLDVPIRTNNLPG